MFPQPSCHLTSANDVSQQVWAVPSSWASNKVLSIHACFVNQHLHASKQLIWWLEWNKETPPQSALTQVCWKVPNLNEDICQMTCVSDLRL